MAVGAYKLILCKFVLELGEGSFDARNAHQTLVALLVAGVVSRSTGTLRYRLARLGRLVCPVSGYLFVGRTTGKSRLKDDDTKRDQRRSSEDAKREQPPFVEMPSDMPSYRPGRACAAWPLQGSARYIRRCRHSQLAASITLRIPETQMHEGIESEPGASRAVCAGRIACPRPNTTLLLPLVLTHYLRRTSAYATTPAPRSRAAAGKSSADGANGPPLLGSGAVDSISMVRSTTTSVSVCAMPVGTRISIATRAAVASKTSFFTREPPSSTFLHTSGTLHSVIREDGMAA